MKKIYTIIIHVSDVQYFNNLGHSDNGLQYNFMNSTTMQVTDNILQENCMDYATIQVTVTMFKKKILWIVQQNA